jgi:2'-5' RNA ligase
MLATPGVPSREETALAIIAPEAEPVVKKFRDKYDPSAAYGMPAHIALLYPFKQSGDVTKEVIYDLTNFFLRYSRFTFSLPETKKFPNVLYLAPNPDMPFEELIQALTAQYPETPPYGGVFSKVIPHLTIAQVSEAEQLDRIADEFGRESEANLPIDAEADKVWLMVNRRGRWQAWFSFDLSSA